MSPDEIRLLELSFLHGVGPATLAGIAAASTSLPDDPAALAALDPRLRKALASHGAWQQAQQQAARQIEISAESGDHIICTVGGGTLKSLCGVSDAPAFLYCRGDLDALSRPGIAIIGTREPSPHGELSAQRIAEHFSSRSWSVVSGLARGCDAAAHRATVAQHGKTVAVLAHGLQTIAPAEHESLAARIIEEGGLLVTEYPYGTEPRPHLFVHRDRIQAALSCGVVLVQSDEKGGSLHACRAAVRYGRPVIVVQPTSKDVEQRHPKIAANLLLLSDNHEAIRSLLRDPESRSRIVPLRSKGDYDALESLLQMPIA